MSNQAKHISGSDPLTHVYTDDAEIARLRAENDRLMRELAECQVGFETGTKAIEQLRQAQEKLQLAEQIIEQYYLTRGLPPGMVSALRQWRAGRCLKKGNE